MNVSRFGKGSVLSLIGNNLGWVIAGILFLIILIPRTLITRWITLFFKGVGLLLLGSIAIIANIEDTTAFIERFETGPLQERAKRWLCSYRPANPWLSFFCDDYRPPLGTGGGAAGTSSSAEQDAATEMRLRAQEQGGNAAIDTTQSTQPHTQPERMAANVDTAQRLEVVTGSPGQRRLLQLQPGLGRIESARDCEDCPEMVLIPSGPFQMGASPFDSKAKRNERPVRRVEISKPFLISKHEVTRRQWAACARAGACDSRPATGEANTPDDRPVVNVSWIEATRYAAWLGDTTGKTYRLPSEAEWEYAARSTSKRRFWWGHETEPPYANYNPSKDPRQAAQQAAAPAKTAGLAPVQSYPPNFWGLYHVHGNVAEWVQDCWRASHDGAPADGAAVLTGVNGECARRVVRGGSWLDREEQIRVSARRPKLETQQDPYTGFRVVREIGETF